MTENQKIRQIMHEVYNIWWKRYRDLSAAELTDLVMERAVGEAGELIIRFRHPLCEAIVMQLLQELDDRWVNLQNVETKFKEAL